MENASNMTILLIDSYDSFTFNLSTQLEQVTNSKVVTIHNDKISIKDLNESIDLFDAVVIGPGPGSPDNPTDIGIIPEIWKLDIPVMGVCLGFQSLILYSGGKILRLKEPKHGQPSRIRHNGDSIFQHIDTGFESIRYHSLYADENNYGNIIPLAWSEDDGVLMAGKHPEKPFFGVQYHPESICSLNGDSVLKNFWNIALENRKHRPSTPPPAWTLEEFVSKYSIKPAPLAKSEVPSCSKRRSSTTSCPAPVHCEEVTFSEDASKLAVTICEKVIKETQGNDFVLLNSAKEPGRWSIIGVLVKGETKTIHTSNHDKLYLGVYGEDPKTDSVVNLSEDYPVWNYLAEYMEPKILLHKSYADDPLTLPFSGGLIGYISYEEDVSMVDIEKTILIDSKTSKVFVLSINTDDGEIYVGDTADQIVDIMMNPSKDSSLDNIPESCKDIFTQPPQFALPDKDEYLNDIRKCQDYLRSGDSYELCLTAQTKITLEDNLDPWLLYKMLLKNNPAPYSCFMDKGFEATLVGSSPERFMSWDRDGKCEFRPIKGTVKKTPEMTREKAENILKSTKERGENLMIVDLIRHDLNQLLDNVRVEKLMTVEEYHTVYQLVSVIQGDIPHKGYLGIDLLDHSFPPGSMTGAPKKRSVELLKSLEKGPRGVYSGVCGYWSVTDQGDWSVIIRSMFKNHNDEGNVWRIGAGGAITILSNPDDEWEEMCTKLERPLGVFGHE